MCSKGESSFVTIYFIKKKYMWLNAQLAIGNKMREKAMLESYKIKEIETFVKDEFLINVKSIWINTKTQLLNNWIKTINDLKKWTYKDINLSIVSVLALDRFLEKIEKDEMEKEIAVKTAESIEWKINENVEVVELEENFLDKE